MSFWEKMFGKKKEKKAGEPTETSFNTEEATAFLKKKYDENLQLLNNEVENAMFHKKRSVRNKRLLNLFILNKKSELLKPVIDAQKELDSLKKNIEDMEKKKEENDEYNRTLLELEKKLISEKENLRKLEASDEWNRLNRLTER